MPLLVNRIPRIDRLPEPVMVVSGVNSRHARPAVQKEKCFALTVAAWVPCPQVQDKEPLASCQRSANGDKLSPAVLNNWPE
jgi:hypothetical protein